ncbi:MAG: DUF2802 domain-containing protein [Bdellovibrionales bacterium]|nr:DUF2802 domain-containing protein [Bdellovibrionales bacterium]
MGIWFLIQIAVNIFFLIGLSMCLVKIFKDKEDDPRLSQGLRLLQSKIAILEDLSDHTENQVKQLMALLDKKLQEVRKAMSSVNQHICEVDRSIAKSQKMAEKIANEIPHQQIVEKNLENKYIKAAQMAHQGSGVDEIVQSLGLPRGEVELITKINRKKFVYEKSAPSSVSEELFEKSMALPDIQTSSMERTYLNFHEAVQEHKDKDSGFEAVKLG